MLLIYYDLDAEFSLVDIIMAIFKLSSGPLKHDSVGRRTGLDKAQPEAPLDDVAVSRWNILYEIPKLKNLVLHIILTILESSQTIHTSSNSLCKSHSATAPPKPRC